MSDKNLVKGEECREESGMNSHISLKEVCDFILDGTHGSPERVDEGIPVLSAQNIVNNRLNFATDRFTTEAEYQAFSRRLRIRKGDVLLTIVGTIGRAAVVDDWMPSVFQRSVAVLRPKSDLLDSQFLFHSTQSIVFRDQIRKATNQSSQAGVYLGKLEKIKISLPPIAEQKRIAAILDKAEELRSLRRKSIEQLEAIVQSIFLEMFGAPIDNPKQFQVKQLIEVVDPTRPISYGILMPGADQKVGVLYVRVVDMKEGGIALANIRRTTLEISNEFRRSLLKAGDLLLSIRGHVGRLAIVPPALESANITQDTARLAIKDAEAAFVCECLRSTSFQGWMKKHTKGIAVRGINLGDVKQMPIILPPISLQKEFTRRVEAIEQLKTTHRESLAQLDALFASLQHRAFRGEL